jgi:hypothetical protein
LATARGVHLGQRRLRYCAKAKKLLGELGYSFAEVKLDHSDRSRIVGLEELERWAKKAA